jgi:LysM repeat protein
MNNSSPLIPQGSLLGQKDKGRARVRLAVFFVLSVHVIGLMALLMQGCRRQQPETTVETNLITPAFEATAPPATETNPPPAAAVAPPVVEPAPPPAPPPPEDYVVAKGDTFSSIAKKLGVTVKAIEEANPGVAPTKLQIGQKLHIPAVAPTAASPASAPAAVETGTAGEQVYTVKSGDTLTKIATQFGATVKALRSANDLVTDRIKVGQKLKIPVKVSEPVPTPAVPPPAASNPGA